MKKLLSYSSKFYILIFFTLIITVIFLSSSRVEFLFLGIATGIVTIVLLFHAISTYNISQKSSDSTLGVGHTIQLAMDISYDRLFELLNDYFSRIQNAEVQKTDKSDGIIQVIFPTSILLNTFSGGYYSEDLLTIHIREISIKHIHAYIDSRPNAPLILVDYGRNLKHINDIIDFMKIRRIPNFIDSFDTNGLCPQCGNK